MAKILIVDDHPIVREGLSGRIKTQPDWEVCGEAADVAEALVAVAETNPDLAIVDLSLAQGNGIELIKDIKVRNPRVRMLVLSAYDEALYAERALKAGALGYLNKQECREKIIDAIRTVLDGRRFLSPAMTERLLNRAIRGEEKTSESVVDMLSDRELEVFQLIGQGVGTQAIAKRLHLSVHTVDTHRQKIKSKLNLKDTPELTRRAVEWVLNHQ